MKQQRAYAQLEIKAIGDDGDGGKRTFRGIATTPTTDRMGDVVESTGAQFSLPIPLLWQHDSRQPIGWVTRATVTATGIEVEGEIATVDKAGTLRDRLEEAWDMLKAKLVRGLSIGFNSIESARIDGTYGMRFLKWEWLELSAVTIAANQDASIQTIKSIDRELQRAAPGAAPVVFLKGHQPGASGQQQQPRSAATSVAASAATQKEPEVKKTIAEQIADFTARKQVAMDRQTALLERSSDEGRTFDEAEGEEDDALALEIKAIDQHMVRLERAQAANVGAATVVPAAAGTAAEVSRAARQSTPIVSVRRNLPMGVAFTRYAMILARSRGNLMQAEVLAKQFEATTPEVGMALKAAVAAGTTQDTTWAEPLVQLQDMQSEFVEYLRPQTLLGNIPGIRRVPFNIKFTRQTSGSSGTFVGEGQPKPLGKMDFELLSLGIAKAATIMVLTEELARFSNPGAEVLARDDLAKGIATYLDRRFIDPSYAGVENVSPASITNGAPSIASTGATIAAVDADTKGALAAMIAAEVNLGGLVWIMNPGKALSLSMKRNTDGTKAYPEIRPQGGTFQGYPVIVSNNVALVGSPTDSFVALLDPSEIMLADDGGVSIDMSTEASLQMSDTPTGGATSLVSLWQMNLIGLRAERFINWRKRRAAAVQLITSVDW